MKRALYRAADGSWWETLASDDALALYTLEPGERWELLDDGNVLVVHPGRPLKVVYPDGVVEEIAASG